MPGSFRNFDHVVAALVATLQPARALDIGCGAGKYGQMLREHAPDCRRIGIEIEASYVERFGLGTLYHDLRLGEAQAVLRRDLGECFDLCLIGDCIEHMPKSAGLDLLNHLCYRCQYLVVLAPEFCVQGSVGGVDAEAHVSVWSEHDFGWHDRWAWDNCFTITAFVLRGYQRATIDFDRLVDGLNAARIPLLDFHGTRELRPAALKKQVRLREDRIGDEVHCFRPR